MLVIFTLLVSTLIAGLVHPNSGIAADVGLIIPGGRLGQFRHGTLVTKRPDGELVVARSPELATHTHPGVDVPARCGSPIYPAADGHVFDVIRGDRDPDFRALGYMVIVRHKQPVAGKDTYSIYLHMQSPPQVLPRNEVTAGRTILGLVGETGVAFGFGCHSHVEIRHFSSRYLQDPGWNQPWNIYGRGDQRNSQRFIENWQDPLVFLSALARRASDEARLPSAKPAVPSINPQVVVSPSSGPRGTTFNQPGQGFTPNSTVTLHFRKPDGSLYPPVRKSADSQGRYNNVWTAPQEALTGTYQYWAVDDRTRKQSNVVTFTVTAPTGTLGQQPTQAPSSQPKPTRKRR